MLFTGLEHTAIASPNPKRLADWYVENLSFVINFVYDGNYFVKAPDGAMLEIVPSEGSAPETGGRTPGLRHLAIAVSNFDAAYADLQAKGVHFTNQPFSNQGNRLVFFTDADGTLLHLIEREKPLP
jgi:glyoxylase I family protein